MIMLADTGQEFHQNSTSTHKKLPSPDEKHLPKCTANTILNDKSKMFFF